MEPLFLRNAREFGLDLRERDGQVELNLAPWLSPHRGKKQNSKDLFQQQLKQTFLTESPPSRVQSKGWSPTKSGSRDGWSPTKSSSQAGWSPSKSSSSFPSPGSKPSTAPSQQTLLTQPPVGKTRSTIDKDPVKTLSKKDAAKSMLQRASAMRAGSQRAIQRDKAYQLELNARWQREFDENSNGALTKKQAQLFTFHQDHRSLGRAAAPGWLSDAQTLEAEIVHALPEWLATHFVEFSMPHFERLQRALEMVATISDPELGLRPQPDHFSRPAFCRFILDSGLVDCDPAATNSVSYHQAVCFFDVYALKEATVDGIHTNSLLSCTPSLSFHCIVEIINQLLARVADPPTAQEQFFEHGLSRLWRIGQAFLDKRFTKLKQRTIELSDDSHNASLVSYKHRKECMSIHGAPPRIFNGSVQDWAQGLHYWMHTGDDNSTPKAIERQHNQESALDSYLVDMIIEPGVLFVAQECRHIFDTLFEVYADEIRRKWDNEGNAKLVKHLSCATFFRFCVDFGVFPTLCCFGFAKQAYREVECMEDLGQRPAPPAPPSEHDSEFSVPVQPALMVSQTTGVGRNGKKLDNVKSPPMPNMKRRNSLSNSDTSSQVSLQLPPAVVGSIGPPKLQKVNTGALLPKSLSGKERGGSSASGSVSDATGKGSGKDRAGKRSTSKEPPQERRPSKTALHLLQNPPLPVVPERIVVAIDLSWIKMHFSAMSQQRLKIYTLLHAIGDCAADNFNTVVGLFTSVIVEVDGEDSDAEDTRSTVDGIAYGSEKQPMLYGTEKQPMSPGERMVGAIEIVDSLRKLRVTHPWTVVDVEDFVLTLVKEEGKIRLLDLEKTAGRIREDAQRRSTAELAFLGLQVDRTWLTQGVEGAPGSNFNQGGIPAQAALGPGSLSLGDQARHIENEAGWLIKDEVTKKFAFNSACFMECMFRIAFSYLHSTAVPAHSAMPAGPKAVWLMTFLHHRFDHLLGVHQAASGCKSQRSTEASTRPWTPESSALDTPVFRPPSAGTTSSSPLPAHNAGWADQQVNKVDWVAKRPNSSAGRRDLLDSLPQSKPVPKLPKPDSTYMSKKVRVLEDYPYLFETLPWLPNSRKRPVSGAGKRPQSGTGIMKGRQQSGTAPPAEESIESNALAFAICDNCKRKRNADGVGNLHCHACSGITSASLRRNPMWPVISHRKLHRERPELFHFGKDGGALSDIASQMDGKDDRLGSKRQGSKVASETGSQIGDKAASVNSGAPSAENDGLMSKEPTNDRRFARTSATVEMGDIDHPGHHELHNDLAHHMT